MRIRATIVALFTLVLLVFASSARAQVSIGISIGAPPAPPPVYYAPPPPPAPEYVWVPGYWYPVKHNYRWHEGYWTRPPYQGAVWVGPRYERNQYYEGYWSGGRGRLVHDHRWDDDRDRDYDRPGHGRGRGRGHDRDDD